MTPSYLECPNKMVSAANGVDYAFRELGYGAVPLVLLQHFRQTGRNAPHAFAARGLAALTPGSPRPRTVHAAFDAAGAERLRELLHRSPRDFGHPTSPWTLGLAAQTAHAEGPTPTRVTGAAVRATLARHGVGGKRAKRWVASPDPAYQRKNARATA